MHSKHVDRNVLGTTTSKLLTAQGRHLKQGTGAVAALAYAVEQRQNAINVSKKQRPTKKMKSNQTHDENVFVVWNNDTNERLI